MTKPLTTLAPKKADVQEIGAERQPIERSTYDPMPFFKELGVSKNSGYAAIKRGDIPHVRIGKRILIPRAAGDRLLGK